MDREEQILRLAALIRKVDGAHLLGASAIAEALVDQGVQIPDGPLPTEPRQGANMELLKIIGNTVTMMPGLRFMQILDFLGIVRPTPGSIQATDRYYEESEATLAGVRQQMTEFYAFRQTKYAKGEK